MTNQITMEQTPLNSLDRCDRCGAQAYVRAILVSGGELLFCSHHYNKIVDSPAGYTKMMAFMSAVLDERERLTTNKPIGAI